MNYKLFYRLVVVGLVVGLGSCNWRQSGQGDPIVQDSVEDSPERSLEEEVPSSVYALMITPERPVAGQPFRILAAGGPEIQKSRIVVTGLGAHEARLIRKADGYPYWRIDESLAGGEGNYHIGLQVGNREVAGMDIVVAADPGVVPFSGAIWKTRQGWGAETEALYSAWINALFRDADERSSWTALHEVTRDPEHNFLYNHLGLKEDDPAGKTTVMMEPDCADNPYYFRAYFAWKLGLPFGYHEADRGWLGKAPQTGRWITNESPTSKNHPVLAFNAFLRRVMDGVHSGSARTALQNDNSDYYPVPLTVAALRPGVVFADPYGHTFVLVNRIPQSGNRPGILLAVDAQPDGTVAVKRFWKGNFLFNTEEVVGEPGFKAFRPIILAEGRLRLMKNEEINDFPGLLPFSLQQKDLEADEFYHAMERTINPKPMDPETVLLDLIQALHEQLIVRVNSVANGENYMKSHPGAVIPMPGTAAGVFLAGGPWEDFSTPNRDLRLLIAMDAVLDFPERVGQYPKDYKIGKLTNPDLVKAKLSQLITKTTSQLTITYTRTDGLEQILTLAEILNRREGFEIAYNPNDCIEVRWGAPEGGAERSACRRRAPDGQRERMLKVRPWFQKRLHPPT